MVSFISQVPLPGAGAAGGLAFDGCRYYLTGRCAPTIAVLDRDLRPVETLAAARPYPSLCYDPARECFWAAAGKDRAVLVRLDRDLRERGWITPCLEGRPVGPVSGLSLCPDSGYLLVAAGGRLAETDPADGSSRLLREEGGSGLILAAAGRQDGCLLAVLRRGRTILTLTDREGAVRAEELVPGDLAVNALVSAPCGGVLMLADRGGCAPTIFCGHPGERGGCGDLLESAALVEAALAHILNAEGEKLRKAAALAGSGAELLAADASLREVLAAVAALERVLLARLELCGGGGL